MNPRVLIAGLAAIVVCFAVVSVRMAQGISDNIAASDREFAVANEVLSPLFDIYALSLVDGQAKVSRGLMPRETFCASISKLEAEAEALIEKYENSEKPDAAGLKAQHLKVKGYLARVRTVCSSGDLSELNSTGMTKDLYEIIDPMTEIINGLLEHSLNVSRGHKASADKSVSKIHRFNEVAIGLALVFSVAPWISKTKKKGKK